MIATTEEINQLIRNNKHTIDVGKISDGYHTIDELYEHRIELWITVCRILKEFDFSRNPLVWRSRKHSDGELAFGGDWFVLGIGEVKGNQMTYHLPMKYWEQCEFAVTLIKAPEFDDHTSEDVLERLKKL